jgi:4-nitrophenyl phosphatase
MEMKKNNPAIQALILDMDGVLWRGDEPIGDLPAIFATITRRNWQVTLATNNATLSVDQYVEKIARMGVSLNRHQIVNSALATAHYLHKLFPDGGSVYIVGEIGLALTLAEYGFTALPIRVEELPAKQDQIKAVIVAYDRQVTYEKLTIATRLIRSGALFLATNPDRTFPTPQGLVPGAGAILAAIEAATGEKALIIGKPSPEMYLVALENMGVAPQNTLVVGDRLETDIAGGQKLGCQTALVLSGVTSAQSAQQWRPPPTWIAPDLTTLLNTIV